MEELMTIKGAVKEVLEECPNSRNPDKLLTILVYKKLGFKIWIEDLRGSPSFESIRRWRQKLQNTNELLTADEDVIILRNKSEEEFRRTFR